MKFHSADSISMNVTDFPYKHPPIAKGNNQVSLSIMSSRPITDIDEFNDVCSVICQYAYKTFI